MALSAARRPHRDRLAVEVEAPRAIAAHRLCRNRDPTRRCSDARVSRVTTHLLVALRCRLRRTELMVWVRFIIT
jgi:hypothetical protein